MAVLETFSTTIQVSVTSISVRFPHHTQGARFLRTQIASDCLNSEIHTSTTLPPRPLIFHGRDAFIADTVKQLAGPSTAKIAVLGPGGIGKTTVAVALLYEPLVVEHFGTNYRLFLSCEALAYGDVNGLVISLAKLFGLPASSDLLTTVVTHFKNIPCVLLVLDNFETVWLAGGEPVAAIDELLGTLAQIPSLSLMITCRGGILPQTVDWSNPDSAALKPFSLEAALDTFQDKARCVLTGEERTIAEQLLNAVDRIPLAVSLLGQLARLGNSLSELLDRWSYEHSALLRTHGDGRLSSVDGSIEFSIKILQAADHSGESLKLLAVCCMLPDGIHPEIFERLRVQFKHIHRARDTLTAYALASYGADRVLMALSPIRHFVLENHPAHLDHVNALHAIYFDVLERLPVTSSNGQDHAAAALEMGNLSSLLLGLVKKPSQKIVNAVVRLSQFSNTQRPTVTVAAALLPHLEPHPSWKAKCLYAIGNTEFALRNYKSAVDAFAAAMHLFLELGDSAQAADCKTMVGECYRGLNELNYAELLLEEAQGMYASLGNEAGRASCRSRLAVVMRLKGDFPAAIEHLTTAQLILYSIGDILQAVQCNVTLGAVYIQQGDFDSAAAELEHAHSVHIRLGTQGNIAQSSRFLSTIRRMQGDIALAERYLEESQEICRAIRDPEGLAYCAEEFGHLRRDQGRTEDAIEQFKSAHRLFETVQNWAKARHMLYMLDQIEFVPVARSTA